MTFRPDTDRSRWLRRASQVILLPQTRQDTDKGVIWNLAGSTTLEISNSAETHRPNLDSKPWYLNQILKTDIGREGCYTFAQTQTQTKQMVVLLISGYTFAQTLH